MGLVLLYAATTVSKDASNHRTASAVYRADNAVDTASALAMFEAEPRWRVHPSDPSIAFDRVDVTQDGPVFKVVVSFSTARLGLIAPPNIIAEHRYLWRRCRRRAESEIVWNVRRWRVPDIGTTEPYQVWEIEKTKVSEIRPQRTLEVQVTTTDQGVFDAIDAQIGAVHKMPDNRFWQLVDSDTNARDLQTWDVSYTWEFDEGTRYPPVVAGDGFRIAGYDVTEVAIPYDAGVFWRPPYHVAGLVLVPADPVTTPADVSMVLQGRLDFEGWRSLPGTEVL